MTGNRFIEKSHDWTSLSPDFDLHHQAAQNLVPGEGTGDPANASSPGEGTGLPPQPV